MVQLISTDASSLYSTSHMRIHPFTLPNLSIFRSSVQLLKTSLYKQISLVYWLQFVKTHFVFLASRCTCIGVTVKGGHTLLKIWYKPCIIHQYIHSKTTANHTLFSNQIYLPHCLDRLMIPNKHSGQLRQGFHCKRHGYRTTLLATDGLQQIMQEC